MTNTVDSLTLQKSKETCRGLGCTSSTLIKAHIIPAGFGRIIRGKGPNMSISIEKATEAKPQLGEFDTQILCKDCDHKLGAFDDYAIETARKFESEHKNFSNELFEVANFDGDKFAKFVLAVLWRASISKREAFSNVSLGPYEARARDVLFDRTALGKLDAFEVLVQRYTSDHFDMHGLYTLPARTEFLNLNTYWFSLTGFRIIAKFDGRPLRPELKQFIVNGKNVLRGLFLEFESTPEWKNFREIGVNALYRRDRQGRR